MAKLLASSQITIVDLNDAVSLQSYITSTYPRVQFLNNNNTYVPNYSSAQEHVTLNAELYKLGDRTNLVTNPGNEVSSIRWYVKLAPSQEYVQITQSTNDYELMGKSPFFTGIKIKNNIMNQSHPGVTFKNEIDFKEAWMEEHHTQITEIDFSLTVQGNDGVDSYTAILTNPAHSIICYHNGTPDMDEVGISGRAYSDTAAYKGTKLLTAVANNPGAGQYSISISEVQHCTAVKKDNDTFYIDTLTSRTAKISEDGKLIENGSTEEKDAKLTANNVPNGGKVKITFNLEGKTTMVQEMTFSKVFHGANGADGVNGNDGESAKYLTLAIKSGSNVFKYEKNVTTPNVTSTVLEARAFNINAPTYAWSYYANGSWSNIANQSNSTLTVNATDSYFNQSNSITFRCITTGNLSDEITISKLKDGDDSITVQCSNESHVIACSNSGAFKPGEADRAINTVTAYKGSTLLTHTTDATVGKGKFKVTFADNSSITKTVTDNTVKITDMSADSAVLLIDVNCEGTVIRKTMSLSKARDGREGVDGYVASLTNEFHSLPARPDGTITSYAGCASSIELRKGDTLVTSGVTYSVTKNTGVDGRLEGNTFTVTSLSIDSSSVNLTANYNGKTYSKVFTITKNKQGSDGSDSTNYYILPSTKSINKDKKGALNPANVTFQAKKQTGNQALESYNARFKIYSSADGSTFGDAVYTSSTDEASKSYSVPTNAKAIKCEMYLAGGTNTLIDIETINITEDGQDGEKGQDAAYVVVSGENAFKYAPNFIGSPVPSSIMLARTLYNMTGGKWQYFDNVSWVDFSPAETGATLEVTPSKGFFVNSANKVMRVRYSITDSTFDETSIVKVADGAAGADAIAVFLTNESHTVAAEVNGSISNEEKAKATSDVVVLKGADKVTNFTIAKGSETGMTCNVDNATKKITLVDMPNNSMSGQTKITITIEGKTYEKVFSISKSRVGVDGTPAKLVRVNASSQAFVTPKTGAVTPNNVTIATSIQGISNPSCKWLKNNTLIGGQTFANLIVNPSDVAVGSAATYKVQVTGSGVTVEDSVTISHIREGADGTDAYTVVLTNPSHTVPANSSGVVSGGDLAKAKTETIVYKGSSVITPSVAKGTVEPAGKADFTVTSAGLITMTKFDADIDSATCEVIVTAGGQKIKQIFTVTKAKQGVEGSAALAVFVSGKQLFKYPQGSTTPSDYTSITLSAVEQNFPAAPSRKWYADGAVISGQTGTNLSVAHDASYWGNKNTITIKYEAVYGGKTYSDEITIAKLYDGQDTYSVVLTNESHSLACNKDGGVNGGEYEKAATKVVVYKGMTALTASNTAGAGKFTITTNGSMADGSGTCKYIVENGTNVGIQITAANRDSGVVPIEVNIDGGRQIVTKNFSFTKTKIGQTGSSAKVVQITGGSQIIFKENGSIEPSNGVVLTAIKKNVGGTVIWKNNANTQLGTGDSYTVPVSALQNTNIYTIRAEISGDSGVFDTHSIHKIIDGKNAVTSYVWCPLGNAIRNDNMSSVQIDGVVFDGSSNVSASAETKYKWEKKVGTVWETIKGETAGNAGGSAILVNQNDIPSMLVVKCTIKYKSVTQVSSIVIEDIIDPVQADIFSTAGTTFKNGVGETFLMAKVRRNGKEIDAVKLVQNMTGVTGVQGEYAYSKNDKKYFKYDNGKWVAQDKNPSSGDGHEFDYIWTKSDMNGNMIENWRQEGKILYVTSSDIDNKSTFTIDVEG